MAEHDRRGSNVGMNVVSLFSGVGGFDYGFEQAGYNTVFQCEIDEKCRSVLRRHFPDAAQWGDITTLTGEHIVSTLAAHHKTPDVIIWGSPCQDLSVAGKGAGLAGERSGLFYEGMRIINEIRKATNNEYPRISVWENVAGALSSNAGADFGQVIDTMAESGAVVIEWRLLDAQYFGIPQRRRRVFVVAVFDLAAAERCAEPLLPVTEGVRRDTAQGTTQRQETARPTTDSTGSTSERINYARPVGMSVLGSQIVGALCANDGKFPQQQQVMENKVIIEKPLFSFDSAFGSYAGVFENHTPPLKGTQCPPAVTQPQAILMREREGKAGGGKGLLFSPEMSLSLLTANEQRLWIDHDEQTVLRKLMPIECERLMGWADGWTAHGDDGELLTDTHRYRMCGNGVASPVARWIAEHLIRVL